MAGGGSQGPETRGRIVRGMIIAPGDSDGTKDGGTKGDYSGGATVGGFGNERERRRFAAGVLVQLDSCFVHGYPGDKKLARGGCRG